MATLGRWHMVKNMIIAMKMIAILSSVFLRSSLLMTSCFTVAGDLDITRVAELKTNQTDQI